ncbi:D-sedoheptulose-7-phosphate isomerase [[Clostridium] hylemonae]|uniref:Phosphoheptose isomerase family protein n=1 Tax=[Clostridium] hylemonae DSM 15053 TaxID=553973 RepID=C0C0F2_9FIRM|nr:SIS domain-containing protein [[Clostridium] hylemonae]EEG74289.1 phosphoheptose isomerase family protein [[Clostridium] hylemonae DSM 15053]
MNEKQQKRVKLLIDRYPMLGIVEKEIEEVFDILKNCYKRGGKLLIGGNGGSAADAEHIVGELMKGFKSQRTIASDMQEKLCNVDKDMGRVLADDLQGALPAIALGNHLALNSAFANDVDGDQVYAQQVWGYGKKEDVLWAISTSGNACNIKYAIVTAKAKGMTVVGLTGKDGGYLGEKADVSIIVPESETYLVQELHLPIYHCLCLMLEDEFF